MKNAWALRGLILSAAFLVAAAVGTAWAQGAIRCPPPGPPGDTERCLGTDGPDLMIGSALADSIGAARGADTVRASAGNDAVRAGRGGDTVDGGPGSDDVRGGKGPDRISDAAGGDRDIVEAGRGRDEVDVLDGDFRDVVSCGPGEDSVFYEESETDTDRISDDCEIRAIPD